MNEEICELPCVKSWHEWFTGDYHLIELCGTGMFVGHTVMTTKQIGEMVYGKKHNTPVISITMKTKWGPICLN